MHRVSVGRVKGHRGNAGEVTVLVHGEAAFWLELQRVFVVPRSGGDAREYEILESSLALVSEASPVPEMSHEFRTELRRRIVALHNVQNTPIFAMKRGVLTVIKVIIVAGLAAAGIALGGGNGWAPGAGASRSSSRSRPSR